MKPLFSICLCCYNDLGYLKLLLKSIEKHASIPYEVCVLDNASSDGTWKFLQEKLREKNKYNLLIKHSDANTGVSGVNKAVEMSTGEYIVNVNADMYFLPGWDVRILSYLRKYDPCSVSTILIEPLPYNPKYIFFDAGQTYDQFKEGDLLKFYSSEVNGRSRPDLVDFSHPITIRRSLWDKIGGIDKDYWPGMTSDYQFGHDILKTGARTILCSSAVAYHFVSKTIKKAEFDEERALLDKKAHDLFKQKTGYEPEDWKVNIAKSGQVFEG